MSKIITSELVVAYSHCKRKAFFLLNGVSRAGENQYEHILARRAAQNRSKFIDLNHDALESGRCILTPDGTSSKGFLLANCDALWQLPSKTRSRQIIIEPYLVIGTYTATEEDKLRLGFAGYILSEKERHGPSNGSLVRYSGNVQKVKLEPFFPKVRTIINGLQALADNDPSKPPELILNSNCITCQYCKTCLEEAILNDNLSLLDRMTPKLIRKYHQKGIFTTTQLSYLSKPRRSRKRRIATSPTFKLELQALAIRTKKIYLQQSPSLTVLPVELFLDIEGIPDQGIDYLIGLMIRTEQSIISHSFWANSASEEADIFGTCIQEITKYPNAPIYHYGAYETKAFQRMQKKYGLECDAIQERLVNVNSQVYGKVYFPCPSNSLKHLGGFLGANWTTPNASGLQSIVWRYLWEETHGQDYKDRLLTYNQDDCNALRLLVKELQNIAEAGAKLSNVDYADDPKLLTTDVSREVHRAFDEILRSAHHEYNCSCISVRRGLGDETIEPKKRGSPKGHKGYQRIIPTKVNKTVQVARRRVCPKHKGQMLQPLQQKAQNTVIDLVFGKNGCRKIITKYEGKKARCPRCCRDFLPNAITKLKGELFGHRFQAWAVYQRITLRLPYRSITQVFKDLFSEQVSMASIVHFLDRFGVYYASTEKLSLQHILESPFIHVDETKINIQGINQYVWVLTDGMHVIFRLSSTREATLIHDILHDYEGVLVSDFYPGYDGMKCRQQKCLVHLIRNLNDDLWKNPFNAEYEAFVKAVGDLLVPVLADVDKYGLKTRHLRKHERAVEQFYKKWITGKEYKHEITCTYQKRFIRYRESLFVFLTEDDIPWNNNMAERAIRHLAVQRKISGCFFERSAIPYLEMLGIGQTCRFQDKSFLKFLLSGERDVDAFKYRKLPRASNSVASKKEIEVKSDL